MILRISIYLGVGVLCHVLFVGSHLDWSLAWTWLWVFGWPVMLIITFWIVMLVIFIAMLIAAGAKAMFS